MIMIKIASRNWKEKKDSPLSGGGRDALVQGIQNCFAECVSMCKAFKKSHTLNASPKPFFPSSLDQKERN